MTTHVVLWKWQGKPGVEREYTSEHVNTFARMLARYVGNTDVRVVCVTDDPTGVEVETHPLWSDCGELDNAHKPNLPSCYRRLKLYDVETQRAMGIERGERIVSIDLDTIVCGDIAPVLQLEGLYVGWALAGDYHDLVYNGSFQMFTAGTLRDIWEDFDPATSPHVARQAGFLGSDQSWLSMRLVGREGVRDVPFPTFASYPLHVRRLSSFSAKTRMVFFHGTRKPWHDAAQNESQWIKRYWRHE